MWQSLSKKDWNVFWIFERRMRRMIFGPINDTGIWRTRYKNEFYILYDELDVVKVIKTGRLRWLGQLFRMQEVGPCRKLIVLKPEGTIVGKPKLRCLESVEEYLKLCFSTAGQRLGNGPWHQFYRAARSSPRICHFSFLTNFHRYIFIIEIFWGEKYSWMCRKNSDPYVGLRKLQCATRFH